jgi:hypothetical protein
LLVCKPVEWRRRRRRRKRRSTISSSTSGICSGLVVEVVLEWKEKVVWFRDRRGRE